MKRCLVKADDYGFTEAISLGILKAYREGIVRSTGVMINMPAAPAALGWLREAEGLCLGLHINIVVGKPTADPALIPDLIDEQGNFHSSKCTGQNWPRAGIRFLIWIRRWRRWTGRSAGLSR